MASARASATERRPRRDSISGRSASSSSRGITLTGVSLSKGSTATVSMWSGSPPPTKPYTQALCARRARRQSLTPDRRIESRDSVNADDVQVERAVRAQMPVRHFAIRRTLHPLLQPVAVYELQTSEVLSHEGRAPPRIVSNVGTHSVAVNADSGVRRRRDVKPAERRPEHRGRWQEGADHGASGRTQLIVDQQCPSAGIPAGEKEVEAHAVGRGHAGYAVAAASQIEIGIGPGEANALIHSRKLGSRQAYGRDGTGQRPDFWPAGGHHENTERDRERR